MTDIAEELESLENKLRIAKKKASYPLFINTNFEQRRLEDQIAQKQSELKNQINIQESLNFAETVRGELLTELKFKKQRRKTIEDMWKRFNETWGGFTDLQKELSSLEKVLEEIEKDYGKVNKNYGLVDYTRREFEKECTPESFKKLKQAYIEAYTLKREVLKLQKGDPKKIRELTKKLKAWQKKDFVTYKVFVLGLFEKNVEKRLTLRKALFEQKEDLRLIVRKLVIEISKFWKLREKHLEKIHETEAYFKSLEEEEENG